MTAYSLPHWSYFRYLEGELEKCFAYVEPVQQHFGVYSDQFGRIILMAATETENALSAFAQQAGCERPTSILAYYACVSAKYKRFTELEVELPWHAIRCQPWSGWSADSSPDWWSGGYNKIKHARLDHPDAPTLIRAIEAVGGLMVVLLHYYRMLHGNITVPHEIAPRLFEPVERETGIHPGGLFWSWELPDEWPEGARARPPRPDSG